MVGKRVHCDFNEPLGGDLYEGLGYLQMDLVNTNIFPSNGWIARLLNFIPTDHDYNFISNPYNANSSNPLIAFPAAQEDTDNPTQVVIHRRREQGNDFTESEFENEFYSSIEMSSVGRHGY